MKLPDFPRLVPKDKETEMLYNWCYKLYLMLSKEWENGQKVTIHENER